MKQQQTFRHSDVLPRFVADVLWLIDHFVLSVIDQHVQINKLLSVSVRQGDSQALIYQGEER